MCSWVSKLTLDWYKRNCCGPAVRWIAVEPLFGMIGSWIFRARYLPPWFLHDAKEPPPVAVVRAWTRAHKKGFGAAKSVDG